MPDRETRETGEATDAIAGFGRSMAEQACKIFHCLSGKISLQEQEAGKLRTASSTPSLEEAYCRKRTVGWRSSLVAVSARKDNS
jgi:hypothetical protein